MPLANTRMIHPRWQQHHTRLVTGGMEATVRVSRPETLGTRDPVSGRTPVVPARVYYEGPGRVQNRGGLSPAASEAGARLVTGNYLVAVPVDLGDVPLVDDLVEVVCSPDPLQAGLVLHVVDVPTATQILQRNLGADVYRPTIRG
ncbi:DUF6093 family protein [Actinoplanes sp. NBRC 101535]|uniref:DUF6093 family protein n=1 Tax=Actinoplanes sp. NBRC 101535 TaxID=3032196 RepID=UPI0024A1EDEB|nr:DUF6093 family protein [Actinoplanes sp. NBRC 101535]GLY08267.1 hypothetical protein Acsp01_86460 [Actinoplanes sp. NBRC 101535]